MRLPEAAPGSGIIGAMGQSGVGANSMSEYLNHEPFLFIDVDHLGAREVQLIQLLENVAAHSSHTLLIKCPEFCGLVHLSKSHLLARHPMQVLAVRICTAGCNSDDAQYAITVISVDISVDEPQAIIHNRSIEFVLPDNHRRHLRLQQRRYSTSCFV